MRWNYFLQENAPHNLRLAPSSENGVIVHLGIKELQLSGTSVYVLKEASQGQIVQHRKTCVFYYGPGGYNLYKYDSRNALCNIQLKLVWLKRNLPTQCGDLVPSWVTGRSLEGKYHSSIYWKFHGLYNHGY